MLGRPSSPNQFRVEYSMGIVQQSAWLVINPITVYINGFLFDLEDGVSSLISKITLAYNLPDVNLWLGLPLLNFSFFIS